MKIYLKWPSGSWKREVCFPTPIPGFRKNDNPNSKSKTLRVADAPLVQAEYNTAYAATLTAFGSLRPNFAWHPMSGIAKLRICRNVIANIQMNGQTYILGLLDRKCPSIKWKE